jgi:hypothetical protein
MKSDLEKCLSTTNTIASTNYFKEGENINETMLNYEDNEALPNFDDPE